MILCFFVLRFRLAGHRSGEIPRRYCLRGLRRALSEHLPGEQGIRGVRRFPRLAALQQPARPTRRLHLL